MSAEGPLLVAHDGSAGADAALEAAAALLPGRPVRVLHVWHQPVPSRADVERLWEPDRSFDDVTAALREEACLAAQASADAAAARVPGAEAALRESFGGAWFEIADEARRCEAAAIVLGARGAGRADVLGRVADAVVGLADRPVLVVPEGSAAPGPDAPLVIGFDGSDGARRAIEAAGALLPGRAALVVHAGDEETAQEGARAAEAAGVAAEARAASRGLHPVRPESGPWHALAEVAEAEGAAAIVVGRRGAGAVRRALLGSVVTALLRHARRPVLVVPPR